MRKTPAPLGLTLGLALLATAAVPAPDASAQASENTPLSVDPGERFDRTRPGQTIVVTQRPLRTFRGEAVRVGRFANDDRVIGVTRAVRVDPTNDYRSLFSELNRFDRSDRWYTREVARGRIVLEAFPDPYTRIERSIGVVRPYNVPLPVRRNGPRTVTGSAQGASDQGVADVGSPSFRTLTEGPVSVTAVTNVQVPQDAADQPWTLLDRGLYREAAAAFSERLEQRDDPTLRTGAALAALLSGDLQAGVDQMPEVPELSAEVRLSEATRRRMRQTAEFLYADNAGMQQALQTLAEAATPRAETAN
jgi:hypothetical protein